MKRRTASCPSCGGPVQFDIGAVTAVCDFCQTAVARGDKEVEDYGKVADLIETSSQLRRGLTGTFNKKRFSIAGRVQYRHPAGGVWDEWYLAFPSGRWGWLAEAQGKTHLMFEKRLKSGAGIPKFDDMGVGTNVELAGINFTVSERGVAEAAAAEGEIPWAFHSGDDHRFVDMQDSEGRFATLEYGNETRLFVGNEISLDDLQLVGQGWQMDEEKISTTALQLNCPQCGGQLVLRAPDQSLRVTCPSCNSLLDADAGKLSYFKTLKSNERIRPAIPLGSEGELFGHKYTVIGFMSRYAVWQGKTFPWSEYLLYEPSVGYRWLVRNQDHWSFVQPAHKAVPNTGGKQITYDGDSFRIYDRGTAYVRYVIGEFYWRVEVGEKVRTADFIAPPRMLSCEWSKTGKSEELNVSMGTYVTVNEISQAFGVDKISRPWGVGVTQPGPWPGWGLFLLWPVFLLVTIIIHAAFGKPGLNQGSDGWLCFYGLLMVSAVPIAILVYRYSFEVKRWEDSDYSPYATE
jgi:predicted RNA-binding Zn-ribbon protein involved in translation (DUF1610 family)